MPTTLAEWAVAVPVGLIAVAIPLALLVWLWPAIVAAGMFGVAVFFVVLAVGMLMAALCLWLGAPLVFVLAALLAVVFSAVRGLYRMATR